MPKHVKGKFKSRIDRVRILSLLLAGSVLSGCAAVETLPGFGDADTAPLQNDLRATLPYDVSISGIDPQEERLIAAINEASTARRLQSRPTGTLAGLQRRAEDDVERFQAVLRSFGFYDGRVEFTITEKPLGEVSLGAPRNGDDGETVTDGQDTSPDVTAATDADTETATSPQEEAKEARRPVVLDYQIDTGTPYLLSSVMLEIIHPDRTVNRDATQEELAATKLTHGQRAEAEPIILGEQYAVDLLKKRGYPLVRAGKRTVLADTVGKTISVTYQLIAGAQAGFGDVTVKGAKDVDPEFIAGYRSWSRGQRFTPLEVATTRRDLAQSNLFESVIVKPVGPVTENGEIPIEIEVLERKHRSIGGGIDFSTAEGPGVNAFWEHRNLFGRGEKLRVGAAASGQEQGLELAFRKPQFLRRKQALVAEGNAKSYDTEAYSGEAVDSFVGIERPLGEYWSATLGVTAEYSDLSGSDSPNEKFYLGGLRGILRRDSTDNPLDPTEGNRLSFNVAPYMSLTDTGTNFTSVSISGSQYLSIDDEGDYVFAARARTGTIIGEERGSLPSNKRFYSGGGGSIRGYEYQKVGPLDENGDPVGGRSVLELGFEFRARVTESFGIVPFVEGGNVYARSEPENISLLWAAGLGFRYYTLVGPLRFDVAVPLDKRENIDDDYQFYISLGQAF